MPVNYTIGMAVTLNDHLKSVSNRRVMAVFSGFCFVTIFFCWYRGFVISLSQISSFFPLDDRISVR